MIDASACQPTGSSETYSDASAGAVIPTDCATYPIVARVRHRSTADLDLLKLPIMTGSFGSSGVVSYLQCLSGRALDRTTHRHRWVRSSDGRPRAGTFLPVTASTLQSISKAQSGGTSASQNIVK
jgi:hypothetical protein